MTGTDGLALSVRHRLLLVLYELAPTGSAVDAETVAVRAWERYPDSFGLRRHNHPNVNAVWSRFCTSDWLVANGLVSRVPEADIPSVRLTAKGVGAARSLLAGRHAGPRRLQTAAPVQRAARRTAAPASAPTPSRPLSPREALFLDRLGELVHRGRRRLLPADRREADGLRALPDLHLAAIHSDRPARASLVLALMAVSPE